METPLLPLAIIFRLFSRLVSFSLMYLTRGVKCSLSSITTPRYLYDFTRFIGRSPIVNRGITCDLQWKSREVPDFLQLSSVGEGLRKGLTPLEMRTRSSAHAWIVVPVVTAIVEI